METIYSRGDDKPPLKLYDSIEKNESCDFIGIPHGLADAGRQTRMTDWSQVHEHHQPIAEVFQARQSFEHNGCPRQSHSSKNNKAEGFFLQDAWKDEIIIGTSASPDHGGTAGRTGIWAPELSSEALFDAFHHRHSFGTTGAKIALFFASGKHLMGDKVERKKSNTKPIKFDLKVVTDNPISKIIIFRNNKIIHEIYDPGEVC